MPTIVDLPEQIAALAEPRQGRFRRIFQVDRVAAACRIPAPMRSWVERQFGSLRAVEAQHVVRVTNQVTFDGALFNPLRRWRPLALRHSPSSAPLVPPGEDLFADPLRMTTEDLFGRVRGRHCVTASNIACWEGQCAVLIFDEPDPLAFSRDHLRDYFRASLEWAQRAHHHDQQARYFLWLWNGGPKGGASIPHAHAQMGLGRGMHYAKVERLRRAALAYRAQHGSNYFDDLLAAHQDVGLDIQVGQLRGFFYLAANRPKDAWLYGQALDDALADALHDLLRALIERTGMRAFDVGVLMPPLFPPAQGEESEDWSGFPVIVRVGDRGAPDMLSSDVGAIDLYAHHTIALDPFEVKRAWAGKK